VIRLEFVVKVLLLLLITAVPMAGQPHSNKTAWCALALKSTSTCYKVYLNWWESVPARILCSVEIQKTSRRKSCPLRM
jgi:hypothetical protein